MEAKIYVDGKASPWYLKARPALYALKKGVEDELERLEKEEIVSQLPLQLCQWWKPTELSEFSATINAPWTKCWNWTTIRFQRQRIYSTIGGGEKIRKLGMSQAYQQLKLNQDSKKYTTINMHKGLFQYNHLPFGVSSAPEILMPTCRHGN